MTLQLTAVVEKNALTVEFALHNPLGVGAAGGQACTHSTPVCLCARSASRGPALGLSIKVPVEECLRSAPDERRPSRGWAMVPRLRVVSRSHWHWLSSCPPMTAVHPVPSNWHAIC
jgi:hypothetical protein